MGNSSFLINNAKPGACIYSPCLFKLPARRSHLGWECWLLLRDLTWIPGLPRPSQFSNHCLELCRMQSPPAGAAGWLLSLFNSFHHLSHTCLSHNEAPAQHYRCHHDNQCRLGTRQAHTVRPVFLLPAGGAADRQCFPKSPWCRPGGLSSPLLHWGRQMGWGWKPISRSILGVGRSSQGKQTATYSSLLVLFELSLSTGGVLFSWAERKEEKPIPSVTMVRLPDAPQATCCSGLCLLTSAIKWTGLSNITECKMQTDSLE